MSNICHYLLDHLVSVFEEALFLDRDSIANQRPALSRAITANGAEIENVKASSMVQSGLAAVQQVVRPSACSTMATSANIQSSSRHW
jgi:hypothetical protein